MSYSRKYIDDYLLPFRHDQGLVRVLGKELLLTRIPEDSSLRVYKLNELNSIMVELDILLNVKAVMVVSKPISESPADTLRNMAELEQILIAVLSNHTGLTKKESQAVLHSLGLFEVNNATYFNAKKIIGGLEFMKVLNSGTITVSINETDKLSKKINRENKIKRIFRN